MTQNKEEEVPLAGGFVNEVVKVGNAVRRTSGAWTAAVHELLHHLENVGFAESPRALGIDDNGREMLSYLPGETIPWTDWPAELCSEDGVTQLGRLIRRYHDAVRTFTPSSEAIWRNPLARSGEIIRHGDFSPFNTTWASGQVVGLIDWDFAQPGTALEDLAYLAWQLVPLQPQERSRQYGIAAEVDPRARLLALCDAYGGPYTPSVVVGAAAEVIEKERQHTAVLAAEGLHPWAMFVRDGSLQAFAAQAEWIHETTDWWTKVRS